MKIFWNLFVYQDTENMYLPDKKSVHHIHMIIINKTSERHRISNKHWQLSWIKTYQTNYDFQAAAVTTYYCVTQRQTHTEHTSERTNTSELSHTYTHTRAFHVQPDRDTLAEILFPKMADRSSVGAQRRWPVRGNALYSSHFPSPQVIFSLFLWMFSPLAQLSCLSPLLCSPLRLIWQTRVREKSPRCTGHTSRCQAKTAALVEISFLLQVVWKINLQKISGNLLIKY